MLAKSYLFVPGNRPERFEKACTSGAGAVILDLEDAVAAYEKVVARQSVVAWLCAGGRAFVRINAADTAWYAEDVSSLVGCAGLLGIVVPKAEDEAALRTVAMSLPESGALLPLIETAAAFDQLGAIARVPRVQRLLFGTIDFQVDTGIRGNGDELLYFRSQLTLVSRIAKIGAPVDGVTVAIDNAELLHDETLRARNLGFSGKLCIHPKQIPYVHAAFAPSAEEIDWARRVIEAVNASRGSATIVDGKMVDLPVIAQAHNVLEIAGIEAL
ncbi:CoA ester lyase [Burkholderia sp. Ac-20345]|uniref:HpcH/HpaI aldolase/citrate lyase family protein n=1 Tax=Burkholderia sp. Ac-20345 TaxID=2703891 RepID=UPI00197B94F5|nr:CoA ester lyase [Burkholderia sp. Ac-20345]MBN3780376.1 CoA ester lyase [Burkholderia sp. Ac-20345]